MKVGVLTIQGLNFGNRLQNYALQTVLGRMGHTARTLRRDVARMRPLKRCIRHILKDDYVNAFHSFDENITFSRAVVSSEEVSPNLVRDFDCFVIGSDQVWNPTFPFNSEFDYLPMVPSEMKVAYAASFGVSEIAADRDRTASLLSGISRISMRESAGSVIVKELTGHDAPVVLDPTMLLTPSDWAMVSKAPRLIDTRHRFLFKYVLGDDVNGGVIDAMASEAGLNVVDVMNREFRLGPAEFVWLSAHADLVCTDSFHASVFALLNHKPLGIFERNDAEADMSSRFDTLCSDFSLESHRSSRPGFSLDVIMENDWGSFETTLASRRGESAAWLVGALEACQGAHG